MKFSIVVEINRSPEDVWRLMSDNDEVMKWMPELVAYKHISGAKGEEGSTTQLSYEIGKTKFDAIMKVEASDFPHTRTTYFAMKDQLAISTEQMEKKGDSATKLMSTVEYNFDSFFLKLSSPILKPLYKSIYLKKFKQMKVFAEAQTSQAT